MANKGSDPVVVNYAQHSQVLVEGLWNFLTTKYRVENVPWGGGLLKAHQLILDVFLPPERLKRSTKMTGDRHCHLEALLEFLYRGTVTVKRDQLDGLLRVAREMDFQMLVDAVMLVGSDSSGGGSRSSKRRRKPTPSRLWEPEIEIVGVENIGQEPSFSEAPGSTMVEAEDCAGDVVDGEMARLHDSWQLQFEDIVSKKGPTDDSGGYRDCKRERTSEKFEFPDREAVGDHRQSSAKKHKCSECDYESSHVSAVRSHLAAVHANEKRLKCTHCDYATNWKGVLKRHVSIVHGMGPSRFTCELCGQRCPSSAEMDTHLRTHARVKPFKCPYCEQVFSQKGSLKSHMHVVHGQGTSGCFVCETCGKRTGSRARLIEHQRTHTQERPFKCETCGQAFSQKTNLKSHVDVVHCRGISAASGGFVCETCGKQCDSRARLVKHQRTHNQDRPHKCQQCSYAASNRHSLTAHMDVVHSLGASRFVCEVCGKRCYSRALYLRHNLTHTKEKPFKCIHCPYACSQKATLKQHSDAVHGAGRFRCEVCGKSLHSASQLARHRRTHDREKQFQCPHCDHAASQKSALRKHLLVVHGPQDTDHFACEMCSKEFSSSEELAVHGKIHNEKNPFDPFRFQAV